MNKMAELDESILKNLKKQVKNLSETVEYSILRILDQSRYFAARYYYTDFDPKIKTKIVRELDFHGFGIQEYNKRDQTFGKFGIHLLGDAKYREMTGKNLILGLTQKKEGRRPNINDAHTQSLAFTTYISQKKKMNFYESPFPICYQIKMFRINEKDSTIKEAKGNTIRQYLMQISSALSYLKIKQSNFKEDINYNFEDIYYFPMLVFGNQVQFVTGYPLEFTDEKIEVPKAIIVMFQSSKPMEFPLIPIIVTSLNHFSNVIKILEKSLVTYLRQAELMKSLPSSDDVI